MTNSPSHPNAHMILIMLFGISFIIIFASCLSKTKFSKLTETHIEDFHKDFSKYCELDISRNFETNAVLSSLYGDHKNSLEYATKDAVTSTVDISFAQNVDSKDIVEKMREVLEDSNTTEETKAHAQMILDVVGREKDLEVLFENKIKVNAKEYILNEASRYHFLLINEAHYSTQHRAFTAELLKPLWDQGYRYLALEALGYNDTQLNQRGYAVNNTGYYTRDPVFGNMIRDALAIGYELISYETETNSSDGTARDLDQATNIFNKTWKKDSTGRVIVHAGYSHILEFAGGSYIPMGAQLKAISGQEILTIDQERMTDLTNDSKVNPYYLHVKRKFNLDEPVIFLDAPKVCVIDSGIQEGHLLLAPAIDAQSSVSFIPGDASTADSVGNGGHGTRVAGAILYPRNIPRNGQYQLVCSLQNARVLSGINGILPPTLYPPELMGEIISKFEGTRIFNMSINSHRSCKLIHMSQWASAIDKLMFERSVLFVVSAGNISKTTSNQSNPGIKDHLDQNRHYPNYLLERASRIANPAQSCFALTVGSVCIDNFDTDL